MPCQLSNCVVARLTGQRRLLCAQIKVLARGIFRLCANVGARTLLRAGLFSTAICSFVCSYVPGRSAVQGTFSETGLAECICRQGVSRATSQAGHGLSRKTALCMACNEAAGRLGVCGIMTTALQCTKTEGWRRQDASPVGTMPGRAWHALANLGMIVRSIS